MAKKKKSENPDIGLVESVMSHYQAWTEDNDKRMHRKGGWNDVTDAYYGKLPEDWPFISKTTDPRIRTSLIEKNARLINGKLRGRLIPREGGDMIKARIQNALLNFQWDSANDGGSMTTKIGICDLDTRLYASKFGLVKWRCEYDDEDNIVFEGNEMDPLDIRDCGIDFAADHIKGAKWFQVRSWEYLDDIENEKDVSGSPIFKNIDQIRITLKEKMKGKTSRRSTEYLSRIKQLKGLEDRLGEDKEFPMIEIVTEYRKDRWITFAPEFNEILRDIPNPYKHGQIPVAQLRYYPLQDDPLGESEVEPVIPLWKAIQATVCGYMDEVILKMRPPLKIIEGAARMETIQYGPEAQWIVTRPDAITEQQSNGESVRYFQTTYSALVAAFSSAMGDLSQGVSGLDPFNPDKTATEVRATVKQQNARDQKNQQDLSEFLKDIMMMWLSNNQQFIFDDPERHEYLLKIVGKENFIFFKQAGLDEMTLTDEAATMVKDIVMQYPQMSDPEYMNIVESAMSPRHPVFENPKEKDPEKLIYKPKMKMGENGQTADIYMTADDMEGTFDYIPDITSMAAGAGQDMTQAREQLVAMTLGNPTVLQLLRDQGRVPDAEEIITDQLEDLGLSDGSRYFQDIQATNQEANAQVGGVPQAVPNQGVPGVPQAPTGGVPAQQMGGPSGVPGQGAVPQGIQ